jgi:hypothetical protein
MAETRKIMIDVEVNPSGASLGNVNKQLDETKTRVKNLKDETDKTSKSMGQGFTAGANAAALIPGPIGAAATAVTGLTGTLTGLKASLVGVRIALVATGIGAFVVIVGSLIAYFTQTERGAQKMRVAMAALGAVVGSVSDVFIGLVDAAQMFIKGDFTGAIDKVSKSVSGLGNEISKDVKSSIELERANNALIVSSRELSVETSKQRSKIIELVKVSDDITKSTKERIDAAKEAKAIEEGLMNKRIALAEENLRIHRTQADLNEKDEDVLQKVAEAEIAVFELKKESLELQTGLLTKLNGLEQEGVAKRDALRTAELAKIKEKNDAEIELAKKLAEEKKAAEEAAIKAAEKRIENQDKIDEYISERKAVTAEEELQLDIDRALDAEQKKYEAVVAAITENQANEQLRKQELDAAKLLYEQEQMVIANDLTAAFNEKKLTDAEKLEADLLKVQQDANSKKVEEEKKVKQARLMVAGQVANGLGAIGQLITQAQGEQTAASKAFAIGQLAINTAMSISEAIAGATTSATATGPGAFVATPLFIATSIATVLASVAQATAILSSAPGGGSVSTPTASSVGATSAPSFSPVTTNTTQLGNTQQAELQPVQAYVVETQITGSQANINQIESQSTFGGG